jgi:hypothetical protein
LWPSLEKVLEVLIHPPLLGVTRFLQTDGRQSAGRSKPEMEAGGRLRLRTDELTSRQPASRASCDLRPATCERPFVLGRLCWACGGYWLGDGGTTGWAEYLRFLLLGRFEVWRGPYLAITGPPRLVTSTVIRPWCRRKRHFGGRTPPPRKSRWAVP